MKRSANNSSVDGDIHIEEIPSKRSATTSGHKNITAQNVNSEESCVGILECVTLKNFMCHDHLTFRLSPNINFVIGRNGSGKSAALTAVIVGLGGRAMLTSRGTSIKNFIKNGKSFTELSIKLRNRGIDAYKEEVYGNSILIVRRINIDGSSNYKIKNEKGQVISNKKEELNHILDQFNIQVDNPVSILNQETSKSFLNTKSSHEKYMFFLRATQLEQITSDYTSADEQKKIAHSLLEEKEQILPELLKEVEDWERMWKFHQTLGDLRTKVDSLKQELVWAHVTEKERALEEEHKIVVATKSRLPSFEQKVKEYKTKVDRSMKQINDNQAKLQEISNEVNNIQPQYNAAKLKLSQLKSAQQTKQLEVRKVSNAFNSFKKERIHILEKIEELKNIALKDYSQEKEKRIEEIETLVKEQNELLAQLKTHDMFCNQLKASITRKKEDIYNFRQEERDLKMTIDQKRRTLHNLEGSQSNQLKRYGNYMPDLLQKINEADRKKCFVRKPVGPIGSHIKLRDPKWALAVETCLGSLLFAFCCHCHEDAKALEEIFRNVITNGRKPTIIVSAFQHEMYNVRNYAVQHGPECSSLMLELEVETAFILNFLIDQRGIEMVLLIPSNDLARTMMSYPENVPPNCREAFTVVGDHIYPAPAYRYYSCNKDKASLLRGSVTDQINEIKEELKGLQTKCQELNTQLKNVSGECQSNEVQHNKAMALVMKLKKKVGQLGIEIAALESVEDPEPIDVTVYEEELEVMSKQLSEQSELNNRLEAEYQDMAKEYQDMKEIYQNLDNQMQNILSDKYEPLKDGLAHIQNALSQQKSHLEHYEGKKVEFLEDLNIIETDYNKNKAVVDEYVIKAEEICIRILTRRTCPNIESEIVQITKQLSSKEKDYGSAEEVTKNYEETRNKYKEINSEVQLLRNWITQLETAMEERQQRYKDFRRYISLRVRYMFITGLTQANYSGKMEFNHEREELTLQVQPLKGVTDLQSDMKSLSGGERSFSLVSFILALWNAMESPFRILDEFDVFMDMVNRRISMDMMLASALHNLSHQFIFLTPLDMTQLKTTRHVKIFKMADPDRTQTSIPYQPIKAHNDEEDDS